MKKYFLILIALLFLSGCSQSADNPYEVAKGTSILSYYDTEDSVSIDGFTILDYKSSNTIKIREQNKDCIIVRDGRIRCIYIVDEDIVTYKGISVGDNIDKLEDIFSNVYQLENIYYVFFNNNTEEDPDNQNKEDSLIWIAYFTDDSQITAIQIYDDLYGRELR